MKMNKYSKVLAAISIAFMTLQGFSPGLIGIPIANAEVANAIPSNPLISLTVNKARYAPGEAATLTVHFDQSMNWSGTLHIQIYQLNKLVAEGSKPITVLSNSSGDLDVSWQPPSTDFQGYIAKAWIEGGSSNAFVTAAIDVSNDWTHFPRYGYVTEFPQETAAQSDAKLKELSQDYYINAYQFYDWMWRHDFSVYSKTDENGDPIKDSKGNFITAPIDANTHYTDLLGRILYPQTIKQEVASAQKYGSSAMAYEMNYAARENYEKFGVKPEWGLYNKNAPIPPNPQKDQAGFFFDTVKPNPTALYLQDPGNPEWQSYITKQFDRAVNEIGFNGIHLDQWGTSDSDYLQSYTGQQRYYSLDYNKLINSVKDSLTTNNPQKNHVTFNMVGGNKDYSTVPNPDTKTDFDYSEIWQDKDNYRDLKKVVDDTRSKDGGKAMVIAGYMNYKQATGINYEATTAEDVPKTVVFQSRINKNSSWVGNFGRKDKDSVTYTVNVPVSGSYTLTLHYAQGNSSGYPEGHLSVNDTVADASIPFDQQTGWGNMMGTKVITANLNQGENKIKLQLNSNNLWLNVGALDVSNNIFNKRYDSIFADYGTSKVDQYGRVYYFETDGDYVQFHVNAAIEGDYPISFSYGIEKNAVQRSLYVNGSKVTGVVYFPATGNWSDFHEGNKQTVHLLPGDNTLTLKDEGSDDTGMNLQYLHVGDDIYLAEYAECGWSPTQAAVIRKVPSVVADSFVRDIQNGPHFIEFHVNAQQAGTQPILFSYAAANDPQGTINVNGADILTDTFVSSGGWGGDNRWLMKSINVPLDAGDNTVRLTLANTNAFMNLDGIYVGGQQILVNDSDKVTLQGGVAVNASSDKDAKTDNFNGDPSKSIKFTLDSQQGGNETLRMWYRSGNNVTANVTVTGSVYQIAMPSNDWYGSNWWGYVDTPIHLAQGQNQITVQLANSNTWLNLHGISLFNQNAKLEAEATDTLVNGATKGSQWIDDFGGAYDTVKIPTNSQSSGSVPVTFTYNSDQSLGYQLFIGMDPTPIAVTFDSTSGTMGQKTINVDLPSGASSIRLQPAVNLQSSILLEKVDVNGSVVEAADSSIVLTGNANKYSLPSQIGYIDNFKQKGDFVQFQQGPVPTSNTYPLTMNFKNTGADTKRSVYVNGRKAGLVILPATGDSWSTAVLPIYLNANDLQTKIMIKMEGETTAVPIQIDNIQVNGTTLEAEDGETGWQPVVVKTGSVMTSIGKTDDHGHQGQAVTFDVDEANAADQLTFMYRSGNNPVFSISVDSQIVADNVVFSSTPGGWDGAMAAKSVKASVAPGKHTVRLEMVSEGQYVNMDSLIINKEEYEAENAALTNGITSSVGYAENFKNNGDFINFDVNAPVEGNYDLSWRYLNHAVSHRTVVRSVYAGDDAGQQISFAPNSSWSDQVMHSIHLKQGSNTISMREIDEDDDGIKLDHLKMSNVDQSYTRLFEAEKASFLSPMTLYKDVIKNFGHVGDTVSFNINVPQSGETSLIFTYSNGGAATNRSLYIDGQRAENSSDYRGQVAFGGTGSTDTYSDDSYFIVPYLTQGTHHITLKMESDNEKGYLQLRGVTLGYFNEPSLRLMDAGLASMGATHIELGTAEKIENGPNMLAHEYYPNRSKKVLDSTKEAMKDYYKFNAAYENLLFDSKAAVDTSIGVKQADLTTVPLSTDGTKNTLWYTVKKNMDNKGFEKYDVIHLINLLNNDEDWRNAANDPVAQHNLKVTYPVGIAENEASNLKVYAASPDEDHGMFKELTYTWDGTNIVIDVPSMQYWSMIFIDHNPITGQVQNLFSSAGQGSIPPIPDPTPVTTPDLGKDHEPTFHPTPVLIPDSGKDHEPTTVVVKEDDLKKAESGQVKISLGTNHGGKVILPANAASILGNNAIFVQNKQVSVVIDPAILGQLIEAYKGKLDANAQIVLNFNQMNSTDSSVLTDVANNNDASMKPIGQVINFELGVTTSDGLLGKLNSFIKPVELTQYYDVVDKNQADLLGVYYYNEASKGWEYIGGIVDSDRQEIHALLPHFSKYAVFAYDKTFSDVSSDHWAYNVIKSLTAKHVILGMTESTFAPSDKTTRAQYAAMLVHSLGLKANGASPFKDVAASEWYANDIAAAYEAKLIHGRSETNFAPNEVVTREEMASMLVNAYELIYGKISSNPSDLSFADASKISPWATETIQKVFTIGLMAGDRDNHFSPVQATTRAEAAQTIYNLLHHS
jgi:dextranase